MNQFQEKNQRPGKFQPKAQFLSTFAQLPDRGECAAVFGSRGLREAHELITAVGKTLEEKLACRYKSEVLVCSQQKSELQSLTKDISKDGAC